MFETLVDYSIWRLRLPAGRMIGDNNCRYDNFQALALCLRTPSGMEGWGYLVLPGAGQFAKSAWYLRQIEPLRDLKTAFADSHWPELRNKSLEELGSHQPDSSSDLAIATEMALEDLIAKGRGMPLCRALGGQNARSRVRAYGSILDFHLSDDDAGELAQKFVRDGFRAVKVKIGASDIHRDIRRLKIVREAVGDGVEITADANIAWTADQAIAALEGIRKAGIRLGYIEDPLCPTDVEGFVKLSRAVDIDVVAHDYTSDPEEIRQLVENGGIQRIRCIIRSRAATMACVEISRRHQTPLVFGNSPFEMSVHLACAFPGVDRMEYSGLAWNDLIAEPVCFDRGEAVAPTKPGHGLDPSPEALKEFSEESS